MKKSKILALLLSAAMVAGMVGCGDSGSGTAGSNESAGSETTEDAAAEDAAGADEGEDAGSTEASVSADGKTVINFYEHSDNEKVITKLVDEYNKSQDKVEVQLSIISNDDYDDKIKVMLSGGADIDAFWVRGGTQVRQMANSGAVLALDDLMEANDVDFSVYGQMGDAFKTNGQTYGMCTTKSCWLLWYNKDLFDAAGLELPTDLTWDEYAELCKELTKDGLTGGITVNWMLNTGSAATGEYLTDENLERTQEYIKHLHRIYVEDQSNPSIEEMSGSFDLGSVFAEGETYLMLNGDWNFLLFPDKQPDFEWGALPLPHFEDIPVNTTVGSTSVFCINSKSEKAEAAFDFIKFCTYSDEGAKIYAEFAGVPSYPSEEALEVYKQEVTTPGTEYVFAADVKSETGNEDYYSELVDAFNAEITEYLIDNCTIDEAFDNFKARREEIVNK